MFTKEVTATRRANISTLRVSHMGTTAADRHAGDLINLQSDAEGNAVYAFETNLLAVTAGSTSVVGRTIVVHAEPDDYRTQPAGNSGGASACGVIRAA